MEKHDIIDLAYELGADFIGFTRAEKLVERSALLLKRKSTEFEEVDIEKRVDPSKHFEASKSIITIAVSYVLAKNVLTNNEIKSSSAAEEDYHLIVGRILDKLQEILEKNGINCFVVCDTQGLLDREIAYRSGLGFYGKNTFIINPKIGSNHNIGYLLVDKYYEEDEPVVMDCGDCQRCVKACPTGAIRGDYTMDATKCVSYLSQSKKSEFVSLRGCFYGCDICQLVCPYNKVVDRNDNNIFSYSDFEGLSNRGFKRKFGNRDFAWVGKKIILRNIEWIKKEREDE